VYLFDTRVKCLVFDMDVMRMPSLSGHYHPSGSTALIDATLKASADMRKLPELYGDHAFLVYVLTDGEENASISHTPVHLREWLNALPENWTVACMVPNSKGIHEAKKFGFAVDNIQIWDANSVKGVETAGRSFRSAVDNYMTMRSQGVRGTRSFFQVDASALTKTAVKQNLTALPKSKYLVLKNEDHQRHQIKPFVEDTIGEYRLGSAYYELIKKETIQVQKQICIMDKAGKVFAGPEARTLLGLPSHNLDVQPGDFGDWRIFVQSTSVNRNIIPGQAVLVLS
jgi:hypothetical protein